MMTATLIALRETFETSLVIGLILALLSRLERRKEQRIVWTGVLAGIVCSVLVAFLFHLAASNLTPAMEEIYEGIMILIGAALLTWVILWMTKTGGMMHASIERKVHSSLACGSMISIFFLSFTTTLREGTELVIFLNAAFLSAGSTLHQLTGALAGIVGALLLTFMVFQNSKRFSLSAFFTGTSALLILIGAGLVSHGVSEFQEAGLLAFWQSTAWNTAALLSENGIVGTLLKAAFGYSDHPSILQIVSGSVYILVVGWWWTVIRNTQRVSAATVVSKATS